MIKIRVEKIKKETEKNNQNLNILLNIRDHCLKINKIDKHLKLYLSRKTKQKQKN